LKRHYIYWEPEEEKPLVLYPKHENGWAESLAVLLLGGIYAISLYFLLGKGF
jgi:hypothetical protein